MAEQDLHTDVVIPSLGIHGARKYVHWSERTNQLTELFVRRMTGIRKVLDECQQRLIEISKRRTIYFASCGLDSTSSVFACIEIATALFSWL